MKERVTVYLISGPCGAGKSTLAALLRKKIPGSVIVEGDYYLNKFAGMEMEPEWEEKITIMWEHIFSSIQIFVSHGYHVIVDTVVEDEWQDVMQFLGQLHVKVKYIVLTAEEAKLKNRLEERGDAFLIERSFFLREKLCANEVNKKYIYDTTGKTPEQISRDFLMSEKFTLKI